MPKYINVDLLLENIKDGVVFTARDKNSPELRGARKIINEIKNAPTADVVEVKRGEWIQSNDDSKKRCSNCDVIHLIAQYPNGQANYCPNCGADMRGGEK